MSARTDGVIDHDSAGLREGWLWIFLQTLIAQTYAIWMAFNGTLDFLDYQLLVLAEMYLVQFARIFFLADQSVKERVELLLLNWLVVLPALFLFMALLAQIAVAQAGQTPLDLGELVLSPVQRLFGPNLQSGLTYLLLCNVLAFLRAFSTPAPARWWNEQVFEQHAILVITFLAMLFLFGPFIIARRNIAWVEGLNPHATSLVLIGLMFALRIGFTVIARHRELIGGTALAPIRRRRAAPTNRRKGRNAA